VYALTGAAITPEIIHFFASPPVKDPKTSGYNNEVACGE